MDDGKILFSKSRLYRSGSGANQRKWHIFYNARSGTVQQDWHLLQSKVNWSAKQFFDRLVSCLQLTNNIWRSTVSLQPNTPWRTTPCISQLDWALSFRYKPCSFLGSQPFYLSFICKRLKTIHLFIIGDNLFRKCPVVHLGLNGGRDSLSTLFPIWLLSSSWCLLWPYFGPGALQVLVSLVNL